MNKLLAIVGPTGVGKTATAIRLASQTQSIVISADSRQVYRGMDIVTGKDHPKDVELLGVDIVNPDESCSVAVWYDSVIGHAQQAWQEGKLVIVVGGTGLYVKALTEGIATMKVPINQNLRNSLAVLSITKLQHELAKVDTTKLASMNNSDKNNPRRLIRAIEVSKDPFFVKQRTDLIAPESTIIGLQYSDKSMHRNIIYDRVLMRLKLGAIEETKALLQQYDPSLPSMSAIGYKSIINYIKNKCSKEDMINQWVREELSYAKRQLTWFRKQPTIWYDTSKIKEYRYDRTKD